MGEGSEQLAVDGAAPQASAIPESAIAESMSGPVDSSRVPLNPSEKLHTAIISKTDVSRASTAAASIVGPKDGGLRATMVLAASFLTNGIVFGVINSYSVIYAELQGRLEAEGVAEASSKASLVGSLTIGCTFALSPVAGVLTDRFGIRPTAALGGCLAAAGMMASSFLSHSVEALYFTYGVLFGVGSSLAYTPSLSILPLHFDRRLGLANGVVTAGSSLFTVILPMLMGWLVEGAGLEVTLRTLAGLVALVPACALCFKAPENTTAHCPPTVVGKDIEAAGVCDEIESPSAGKQTAYKEKKRNFLGVNFDIWRRKKYVIWALSIPLALFGYFVPYVHMVKFVSVNFPNSDGKLLVICIGITSGIGRLVFGKIADLPRVDRILLQQISFVSIGSLTMLLVATDGFNTLTVVALIMGLFDGCFISLLGPIAFDLCGSDGATQAIGFLLGLCSVPLTAGPPIAGALYDHTGSYVLPFLLAGVPPIVGAGFMFLVRCVPSEEGPGSNMDRNVITAEKEGGGKRWNFGKLKANGDLNCGKNKRSGSVGVNCLEAGLYWMDKSLERENRLLRLPKRIKSYSSII